MKNYEVKTLKILDSKRAFSLNQAVFSDYVMHSLGIGAHDSSDVMSFKSAIRNLISDGFISLSEDDNKLYLKTPDSYKEYKQLNPAPLKIPLLISQLIIAMLGILMFWIKHTNAISISCTVLIFLIGIVQIFTHIKTSLLFSLPLAGIGLFISYTYGTTYMSEIPFVVCHGIFLIDLIHYVYTQSVIEKSSRKSTSGINYNHIIITILICIIPAAFVVASVSQSSFDDGFEIGYDNGISDGKELVQTDYDQWLEKLEHSIPQNGTIFIPSHSPAASLEIKSDDNNYFFRLSNRGGTTITTFFVAKNSEYVFPVPLGNFTLNYATGETWHDDTFLFGVDTEFYSYTETFDFLEQGSGWTLDMTVHDGNLFSDEINEDDFWN